MMYLLDTAGINSIILFKKRNCIAGARQRRIILEKLSCDLIRIDAQERMSVASLIYFTGFQASVFTAFDRLIFNINRVRQPANANKEVSLKRCCTKECKLKGNNNKYRHKCGECGNHYCLDHCEKMTTILCTSCINK